MTTNQQLVTELVSGGYLKTPDIIQAFFKVDRANFVRQKSRALAYANHPLPIGFGQTISQPLTVALMLEWLAPKVGDVILDIGFGSGWTVALLASVVGQKGKVIGIERISELLEFAKINLTKYPTSNRTSTLTLGDGSKGFKGVDGNKGRQKFDKIISAATSSRIPEVWKEQLKVGGRIVAPVGDSIVVIDKPSRNKYEETTHRGFSFVPLIED